MPQATDLLRRDVSRVLTSIRVSFERAIMSIDRKESKLLKEAAYSFDRVRFGFHSRHHKPSLSSGSRRSVFERVMTGLQDLLGDSRLRTLADAVPFSLLEGPFMRDGFLEPYSTPMSVAGAAELLVRNIGERLESLEESESSEESLADILPPQSLAPLEFEIVDDVLRVLRRQPRSESEDVANVLQARDALVVSGERVFNELDRTNCDPRLLQCLADLNQKLCNGSSIIAVGLANINFSLMTKVYADELANPVQALLTGHSVGVRMYVSQFPDWTRFAEKAAMADLTESQKETIAKATDDVIEALDRDPHLAEPEIPRTLQFLRQFAINPSAEAKRISFALLRTLENLCICVFRYGEDFLNLTLEKVKVDLSKGTARVAVGTLLALAVYAAATLTPVASVIAESQWLPRAVEIAKKQLDEITG